MNQKEQILELMREGWVSPILALEECGCFRLGARLLEIKNEGYPVEERWVERESRFGKKTWKEFRLRKHEEQIVRYLDTI